MDEQRERARKAQKKEEITVEEDDLKGEPTKFIGTIFWRRKRLSKPFCRQKIRRSKYRCRSHSSLCGDGRTGRRSRTATRSGARLDRSWSVARHRHAKARRRFCSSRAARPRSGAGTGRGGAHLSGCRSAQINSGASHGYPFVALGIARKGLARCVAKRKLCRVQTN